MVGRVNQGIRREMRLRLARWGLSVREYTTLSVLDARPGLSNAQLARRAIIEAPSMIEVLAKLETRGLVKRDVDPANVKILRASLTEQGRELLRGADPAIQEIQDEMLAEVPQGEQEAALRVMRTAMDHLSQSKARREPSGT